jgi:hypothetical protein
MKLGFGDAVWEAGKAEGRTMLVEYARRRQMITYTDFVNLLHNIRSATRTTTGSINSYTKFPSLRLELVEAC